MGDLYYSSTYILLRAFSSVGQMQWIQVSNFGRTSVTFYIVTWPIVFQTYLVPEHRDITWNLKEVGQVMSWVFHILQNSILIAEVEEIPPSN